MAPSTRPWLLLELVVIVVASRGLDLKSDLVVEFSEPSHSSQGLKFTETWNDIFAVLFTELFDDLVLSQSYFTSLDVSLFSCYEIDDAGMEEYSQRRHGAAELGMDAVSGLRYDYWLYGVQFIIAVTCDAVSIVDQPRGKGQTNHFRTSRAAAGIRSPENGCFVRASGSHANNSGRNAGNVQSLG